MNQVRNSYPHSGQLAAQCERGPPPPEECPSELAKLDIVSDLLTQLDVQLYAAFETSNRNADRVLGSKVDATVANSINTAKLETPPTSSISRIMAQLKGLLMLAESVNTQAHRFDVL